MVADSVSMSSNFTPNFEKMSLETIKFSLFFRCYFSCDRTLTNKRLNMVTKQKRFFTYFAGMRYSKPRSPDPDSKLC